MNDDVVRELRLQRRSLDTHHSNFFLLNIFYLRKKERILVFFCAKLSFRLSRILSDHFLKSSHSEEMNLWKAFSFFEMKREEYLKSDLLNIFGRNKICKFSY